MESRERLLIIGASARSWIRSSIVAGYDVTGFDLFADWDVQALLDHPSRFGIEANAVRSRIKQIATFDDVLADGNLVDVARCDAAVVFGGFETRLDLIELLRTHLPVLGASTPTLRRLSDAPAAFQSLEQQGIPVPVTQRKLEAGDPPENWMCKRTGSSGGLGVRMASITDHTSDDPSSYFQAKMDGRNLAAVFLSSVDPNGQCWTRLLGVTEQRVGDPRLGAGEFQYCGSIGPVPIPPSWSQAIMQLGEHVGQTFELRGLWGVDFVVSAAGVPFPVDINPRLTASMELFEPSMFSRGCKSMMDLHVRACLGPLQNSERDPFQELRAPEPPTELSAKAILFHKGSAPLSITGGVFADLQNWFDPRYAGSNSPGSSIADVPKVGDVIAPGSPILTLGLRGDESTIRHLLDERVDAIYKCLTVESAAQ